MQGEVNDVDVYLERMGVADPSLRARVEGALPWTNPADIRSSAQIMIRGPIEALNSTARDRLWSTNTPEVGREDDEDAVPLFVVVDAEGGLAALKLIFAAMRRPVFALHLPVVSCFP